MIGWISILLMAFGVASITKADAIDHWHVYYNKTKIGEYNDYKKNDVTLKLGTISKQDVLSINYYTDAPSPDLKTNIVVRNTKHQLVITASGEESGEPISFSLQELKQIAKSSGEKFFDVFYFVGESKNSSMKTVLFRIKLI